MKIIKNYIYNLLYQIMVLLLPFITVPYVSRVLGADGIGVNSFTGSLVQYFVFLGTLGVTLYGNREIAYVRNDKVKLSKVFFEITILKFIMLFAALIIYILIIIFSNMNYKFIFVIQAINILSSMIDSSWFFMGLENFKVTVTRNMLVKVISVIFIFLLVKKPGDVWLYTLIINLSNLLGLATIWIYIPKEVVRVKIRIQDLKNHIKPSIKLFIPQIAVCIYTVLDKSMLGFLTDNSQVGVYDNSQKIIKMILAVVTSLGSVMLPRISNLYNNKDYDQIKAYIVKSFHFVTYLAVPMMFGLISISDKFAIVFFGKGFSEVGLLMTVSSPIIIFIAWSSVTGVQYLLPLGKEKQYTISVIGGSIVNIVINILLISRLKALGACIGMESAELTVAFIQMILVKKLLPLKLMYSDFLKCVISGIGMMICVKTISLFNNNTYSVIFVQVIVGAIVYFILQTVLKVKVNKLIIDKLINNKFFKVIDSKI